MGEKQKKNTYVISENALKDEEKTTDRMVRRN